MPKTPPPEPVPIASAPEGFLSLEAKQGLQRSVLVVGGIFFGLLVLAYASFIALVMSNGLDGEKESEAKAYGVALRPDGVWYLQGQAREGAELHLMHQSASGSAKAKDSFKGDLSEQFLLASSAGERLWLLSKEHNAEWDGKRLKWLPEPPKWNDMNRPFLFRGEPAFLDQNKGSVTVWRLAGQVWKVQDRLQLQGPKGFGEGDCACNRLRLTYGDGTFHWFYKDGQRLRHFAGRPGGRYLDVRRWKPVLEGSGEGNWAPKALAQGLMLVDHGDDGFTKKIRVWRYERRKWLLSEEIVAEAGSVALLEDPKGAATLALSDPGLRLRGLGGPAQAERVLMKATLKQRPWRFVIPFMFLWSVLVFGPLLMLVALDRRNRQARPESIHLAGHQLRLAGLWPRALARFVDEVLVIGTLGAALALTVLAWAKLHPGEPEFYQILLGAVLFVGAFLAAKGVLIFAIGRSGQTPGRVLLGIQVLGKDLKPCGTGRSLLRALGVMVDAFLMWTVGIFMVVLSPHQQRLGDLAADTVVLHKQSLVADAMPPATPTLVTKKRASRSRVARPAAKRKRA